MALQPTQKKRLLDNLDILLEVCQKNQIDIWMIGGSLLGTIRQHEMVKDDDDIDIGIRRADYPRLKELLSQNTDLSLRFSDFQTDDTHPYSGFAKLKDDQISIDIFPFDQQAQRLARLQWGLIRSIDVILGERRLKNRAHSSAFKKIVANILKIITFVFSDTRLLKFRQFWLNRKPVDILINFGSGYQYGKELIFPNEIQTIELQSFENREVPVLNGSVAILQRQYGKDWQTPKSTTNHQK